MFKQATLLTCIMVVSLVAVNPSSSAIDGLVAAWLFDTGSGNTAIDSSGNGHDGELIGNATWEQNGKFGSALSCDGTEAYVLVPDHEDFEFDGDFSIACWFQNSVTPSDHSALATKGYDKPSDAGGDARPWYLVYFLTSGTVDLYLRDAAGTNSRVSGTTPVNDGQWHHVVAMKAGSEVKIYIDGKEDASAAATDATYGENDQPLAFMVHFHRWINGLMDEVAVFDKALSEAEIAAIMGGLRDNILAVDALGKLAVTWGNLKSH
jgi:hypothetical protein